jgi:uncharacterized protein (DUF2126 family)/transglutaminase-like putative cysteine protease
MTIHVALCHETRYRYDRRVSLGPQTIRLRPAVHSRTAVLSYALDVEPKGHFLNWQQDPHGNFLARVVFPEKVDHFTVRVDLVADMAIFNPFDFFLEPEAERFPFVYDETIRRDLEPFLVADPPGPRLAGLLARIDRREAPTVDFLVGLNRLLSEEVKYVIRMEPGVQTPEETLGLGRGSCRDSAWLFTQLLRHLGIASRFVSGYLIQLAPDVEALDGPSGPKHDFTDLHAWTEAYLPGAGWIGLDATSGLLAGEGHIPLACAPHPVSASPVTGVVEKCDVEFDFAMSVTRILETRRVTRPYDEAQWQRIDEFGRALDAELSRGDVRLTVGGEPTFVSIDHPDAPEWNTAALGGAKRVRAADLLSRLAARFAPDGLRHYGQGKWYPGEQLPRWAFSLFWRGDGRPLWTQHAIVAREDADHAPTLDDACALGVAVARRLGVDEDGVSPVYEDPVYFVGAEARLPENLDAATNALDDPLARERLARVMERGLGKPVGYVLPVQRWNARGAGRVWRTERWRTRRGRLFLLPGDSPVGYRLPLPSLPHLEPMRYPHVLPADPFEPRGALPDADASRQPYLRRGETAPAPPAPEVTIGQDISVRTALAIEPRDGRLNVFMPPVETLEDYLDLVAAIEDAAAELGTPLHLEGYTPPHDPRINVIKVTPDPGVIEVNIHPAASWTDLVDITEALYEEARLARLGTEKFMLDGRHTGTGGGNHVVLGGRTPADSPFLRRPDLLRSLLLYWQHHPSLSYLFSGLFIGPTSQAPRIDEARLDALYEIELACAQVPEPPASVPPWIVDRIFRNLLIDVTGNTHRTEICIDKLYSPDGPTGRLGLVEFRAFEMPPNARMSLAQHVLLRALVARFWKSPYRGRPVRWGTALHDRFMLPHYVWADLCDLVADMQRAGYPIESDWFLPHFEFRFPRFGVVEFGGMSLEIRQALEPWHVMGEEGAVGGTVRYVDSSLERLQVKLAGTTDAEQRERYVVGCNGARVPMQSTGAPGEFVGGVRFRAWQPAASLHPRIPIDAPLTFEIYDRWSRRAVAGCTYHVAHPGGRNFERFPVNANEAESRRLARFQPFGHRIGEVPEPVALERPEFAHTLDLRWRAK